MPTNDTFESGINWQVGDLVTAGTLKDTVENATPKKALINGLGAAASIDPVNDRVMIYSNSADDLKRVQVSQVMNSGSDGTVGLLKVRDSLTYDSTHTDANGVIQPNVEVVTGGIVTGGISGVYSCVSGVVTITTVSAVNIKNGDIINVTIAGGDPSIVGEFVNIGTTGSVAYNARNPSVANSSGSCIFDIKGCFKIDETGIGGTPATASLGNTYVRGDLEVIDDATIKGDFEARGTTNLKGDVQYNGTPVYSLYEIVDESMSAQTFNLTSTLTDANVWKSVHTKSNLTKTNKEIWIVEIDVGYYQYCYNAQGFYTGLAYHKIKRNGSVNHLAWVQTGSAHLNSGFSNHLRMSATIPQNVTFTNDTFTYEAYYRWAGAASANAVLHIGYAGFQQDVCQRSFRIYKYIKG